MEPVGNAIYAILYADATVNGLVGTHIYQNLVPQTIQATLYVRHMVIDVHPNDTKSGVSTLDEMTVQIDVFGKKDQQCATLAKAIRAALDRKAHGTYGGVGLLGVKFLGANMLPEQADAVDMYTYTLNFKFRVATT